MKAWSGCVLMGSLRPAIPATIEVHPAVAETTAPAEIGPASVSIPVQPSPSTWIPVTPRPSWTWTPRRVAADAYPHTTESWRAVAPGGGEDAPSTGSDP